MTNQERDELETNMLLEMMELRKKYNQLYKDKLSLEEINKIFIENAEIAYTTMKAVLECSMNFNKI